MKVRTQKGFTLIELLIVVAIIAIIAAIAVPNLMRAKMTTNESSAMGSLRAINSAEASYAASAAPGGFSVDLAVLVRPCPGSSQGFISPDLGATRSVKSGYTVTITDGAGAADVANDCNGVMSRSEYYSTAIPITLGSTGNRTFASTAGGSIFFSLTATPPTEAEMAPGGGGTPIQ